MSDTSIKLGDGLPEIDTLKMQKMIFIYNAVNSGWSVIKKGKNYVFSKPHNNDKEIYLDSYLTDFISDNLRIDSQS